MMPAATLIVLGLLAAGAVFGRRIAGRLRAAEQQARRYRDADAARASAEAARQRAEESERWFRHTADNAPVLLWMSGTEGRINYFNNTWLEFTGRALQQELGGGWVEGIHPDDVERCLDPYRTAFEARQSVRREYRLRRSDGEYRWMLDTGAPRHTTGGEFEGYIGSCIDITERKEAEEAQHVRLEAARVLAWSLDLQETLRQVTTLIVPRFADYCLIRLRAPDGTYNQVAASHVSEAGARWLEELGRRYRPDLTNPHSALARALNGAMPVLSAAPSPDELRSLSADPEVIRIIEQLGPASYTVVPLVARGDVFGAITLATSVSQRRLRASDLALVELLGARAALAIDNARLYADARQVRDEAYRASQLESQLMQARLETLRAQLNPHFLFNALNTIAMLVRRQANADALRGVISLSELLRQVLAGRGALEVTLREELGLVEHYLEIEQLRFRDRLSVGMQVAPDVLDARVPSLILQPLVENAVRHGIAPRAESGRLDIICERESDSLHIEVRDDGPGFAEGWDAARSGGLGLANTRERLQRLYGSDHHLVARNARAGGAVVSLEIPFRTTSSAT